MVRASAFCGVGRKDPGTSELSVYHPIHVSTDLTCLEPGRAQHRTVRQSTAWIVKHHSPRKARTPTELRSGGLDEIHMDTASRAR
jgi:hypothetical protein